MMKIQPFGKSPQKTARRLVACCAAALCLLTATAALGEERLVFAYEGFRFDAPEGMTVLTQHNVEEHAELLSALGTTPTTMQAAMQASGLVLEAFPAGGGQIELAIVPAESLGIVVGAKPAPEDLEALEAAYKGMARYEQVGYTDEAPGWLRMTFSTKQSDVSVYTLRYISLAHGQQFVLSSILIGREPGPADEAMIRDIIGRISFMDAPATPAPSPTPTPEPTPVPTPKPEPSPAARIDGLEGMRLEITPPNGFTEVADFVFTGVTEAEALVSLDVASATVAKAEAGEDGTFTLKGSFETAGAHTVTVRAELADRPTAWASYAITYEMPKMTLTITEPTEPLLRKEGAIRGTTLPNARVDIKGSGLSAHVNANAAGEFSIRLKLESEGEYSYTLTASLRGYESAVMPYTVVRALNYQEALGAFRKALVDISYRRLLDEPEAHTGKNLGYRGRVVKIGDADGVPCLLFNTENVSGKGWSNPIWILCDELPPCEEGAAMLAYVRVTGETMPYTDADGNTENIPVMRLHFYSL